MEAVHHRLRAFQATRRQFSAVWELRTVEDRGGGLPGRSCLTGGCGHHQDEGLIIALDYNVGVDTELPVFGAQGERAGSAGDISAKTSAAEGNVATLAPPKPSHI